MSRILFLFFALALLGLTGYGQDTATICRLRYLNLALSSETNAQNDSIYYRVTFEDHGKAKSVVFTGPFSDAEQYDGCVIKLKQLDGSGLPELIVQLSKQAGGNGGMGGSNLNKQVTKIWNLETGIEMFSAITWYENSMWQYLDFGQGDSSDKKVATQAEQCFWRYELTITEKGEIVLNHLNQQHYFNGYNENGQVVKTYLESCPPVDHDTGTYKISSGKYIKASNKTATEPSKPDKLSRFIPKGYVIKDSLRADLNFDGRKDLLMVLQFDEHMDSVTRKKNYTDTFDFTLRPMIILVRQKNGELKQVRRNDHVIDHHTVWIGGTGGEDPYAGVDVEDGNFSFNIASHGGGQSCTTTTEFCYSFNENDWFLEEVITSCTDFNAPDDNYDVKETSKHTAVDFGKVRFTDYNFNTEY